MTTEEEIAKTLDKAFDEWKGDESEPTFVASRLMPLVKRAQAEALREYRQRLISRQVKQYGIVLPDVHEIVDDLDHVAGCIENEGVGA